MNKELTKEQKLLVVNHAFKEYQNPIFKGNYGMCYMLHKSMELLNVFTAKNNVDLYIPEFKPELLGVKFNNPLDKLGFWWARIDYEVRNKAFKTLIDEIERTN